MNTFCLKVLRLEIVVDLHLSTNFNGMDYIILSGSVGLAEVLQ